MPTRNALGSIRLSYTQSVPNGPYHITLQVWSHSYDHPDPARRSAAIRGVYLIQLTGGSPYNMSHVKIVDRYGVEQNSLWTGVSAPNEAGFEGYVEVDTGKPCQPGFPNVLWGAYTGIYDERCLEDPACDRRRLQTIAQWPQLTSFNYLLGPLTFSFDLALSAPPTAVRLRMSLVGGNGGNPAQRFYTLPDEGFIITVP